MTKIKWAILGTSFISEVMAEAIQKSEQGELAAIVSRSENKGREFANKFQINKIYARAEEMHLDNNIDAVYIGLPNHLHKEGMIKCAQAGKHVLCEKPFTLTLNEAQQAVIECEKAGVICMEALMYRFHPFILKLEDLIQQNMIGQIKLITAVYTANIADIANKTAGGAIRNLGCYPLSLTRLLMRQEPREILVLGHLDDAAKADNQASIMLKFPNNAMAVISTADDLEMFWQFDIYGENGLIKVISNPWKPENENNKILLCINGENPEEIMVSADKSLYVYQVDAMNSKILGVPALRAQTDKQHSLGNVAVMENCLAQLLANSPVLKAIPE